MRELGNNMFLVENASDLPNFSRAKNLYLDFETTSFDPATAAFHPHKGHRIAGTAVTADDCPHAYYVPVRHYRKDGSYQEGNLPEDVHARWLHDVITTCETWANANVKFDAHFASADGAEFRGELLCLTTAAKVLDSDMTFKGGYGLKNLAKRWLEHDITGLQDKVGEYLSNLKLHRNRKAKDYGVVPIDIMAPYAAQDAFTARDLHRYIERRMPEQCYGVWDTERKLTPVLYDIETEGMIVDPEALELSEMQILQELIAIEEKLHSAVGFGVNPSNSSHCYNLLCAHWGLPVLEWNDDGNPSFDKDALVQYLLHPDVKESDKRTNIVRMMQHYRKRHTLLTFFIRPYQEHQVNGVMHPSYNQAVRSGRLSCKRPNAQQLNKEAKSFVLPGDNRAFLSCDYSQIEFRLIVHYTRAVDAIRRYEENPDTDFHQWVAEMCRIPRKPAKNVNFAIGFGAGRRKVMTMLAGNMELMDPEMTSKLTSEEFDAYCRQRAEEVYEKYNAALPGLKPTTRAAARNIMRRGYVFNAYGRRLHLPETHAHIAFNRVVQSCAADIMKERTIAVSPRYNDDIRKLGIRLCGSVHDETLFVGDATTTRDPEVIDRVVNALEDVQPDFRVPIRSGAGWSDANWAAASGDTGELDRAAGWVSTVSA